MTVKRSASGGVGVGSATGIGVCQAYLIGGMGAVGKRLAVEDRPQMFKRSWTLVTMKHRLGKFEAQVVVYTQNQGIRANCLSLRYEATQH